MTAKLRFSFQVEMILFSLSLSLFFNFQSISFESKIVLNFQLLKLINLAG